GQNIVFGDNGRITSAVSNLSRWGSLPITLGRIETTDSTIGAGDTILTGIGDDIVLGGAGGDVITANVGETSLRPDGRDLVFGDHGFFDWTAADPGRGVPAVPGDDTNPADLDRVWSTDPSLGGADTITTGLGDDL